MVDIYWYVVCSLMLENIRMRFHAKSFWKLFGFGRALSSRPAWCPKYVQSLSIFVNIWCIFGTSIWYCTYVRYCVRTYMHRHIGPWGARTQERINTMFNRLWNVRLFIYSTCYIRGLQVIGYKSVQLVAGTPNSPNDKRYPLFSNVRWL